MYLDNKITGVVSLGRDFLENVIHYLPCKNSVPQKM